MCVFRGSSAGSASRRDYRGYLGTVWGYGAPYSSGGVVQSGPPRASDSPECKVDLPNYRSNCTQSTQSKEARRPRIANAHALLVVLCPGPAASTVVYSGCDADPASRVPLSLLDSARTGRDHRTSASLTHTHLCAHASLYSYNTTYLRTHTIKAKKTVGLAVVWVPLWHPWWHHSGHVHILGSGLHSPQLAQITKTQHVAEPPHDLVYRI